MALFHSDMEKCKIREIAKEGALIYFAGIGGVSMSALAELSLARGCRVAGCDRSENENVKRLRALGVTVTEKEKKLPEDTALLVYTLAFPENDALFSDAKRRNIPAVSRADYLGALSEEYKERICVAGSHGKSTVTAMLASIFEAAGYHPTVLGGAPDRETHAVFRAGTRDILLTEACEYRDSFLRFSPTVAVVLNREEDHPDYFSDGRTARDSFTKFLALESVRIRVVGGEFPDALSFDIMRTDADICAKNIELFERSSVFTPVYRGKELNPVTLPVFGRHNVENALAAILTAIACGLPYPAVIKGLSDFHGVSRRMEYVGEFGGAAVYDDYAHHPTEIRASIRAVRPFCKGKLYVYFEPHTYSRTAAYYTDFIDALTLADAVCVSDIYPARETDTLGMSGKKLASDAGGTYLPDYAEALSYFRAHLMPGDVLIVMGAGTIGGFLPVLFPNKQNKEE